jgi:deoxyribodipyrimidine photo-lyase
MNDSLAIVWFRRDLRLADNPALAAALASHRRILPVFIDETGRDDPWMPGAASRWWLHHALADLSGRLDSRLLCLRGEPLAALRRLIAATGAVAVYWNRRYDSASIAIDTAVKRGLRDDGIDVETTNGGLLYEPWTVANRQGRPFRVFTPFWKHLLAHGLPDRPLPEPDVRGRVASPASARPAADEVTVDGLGLLPRIRWYDGMAGAWDPTRDGAVARLDDFLSESLSRYPVGRDRPAVDDVSRLSPYLHFGQIGPREVVAATDRSTDGGMAFLRELGWREFSYQLLYHFPQTVDGPLDPRFAVFPWREAPADLAAWQRGETGIPMVDAGMRQLWQTGWMHNRVRMIVASFLVKNLLLPWQDGAAWFRDTLVDADLANNTMGWQWTAGCGADAAPYFRVFNPVLQGQKFDPEGRYVRRWIPALSRVPAKWVHCPWDAPAAVLDGAGLRLGEDYPRPVVDLKESRVRALAAWERVKAAVQSG